MTRSGAATQRESAPGRTASPLGTDATLGIDIGGTTTDLALLDGDGEVVVSHQVATRHGDALIAGTLAAIAELDLPDGALRAVGIGVPGQVDPTGGTVRLAVNLGIDRTPVPLAAAVAAATGAPVSLENDVRAAALGASLRWWPDASVLVYLGIGTGVAAGIVVDGRLHRGSHGMAGEVGHVVVDPAGVRCGCGARGCLETVVSGSALRRRWGGDEPAAGQAIVAAAAAGDPRAQALLDDVVDHLVVAVQWLMLAYGADVFVLGGGVGRLGDPLLLPMRSRLRARADRSDVGARLVGPERVWCAPAEIPLGAVGAAAVAGATVRPHEAPAASAADPVEATVARDAVPATPTM